MSEVTQILKNVSAGDSAAAEELLPLIYEELRRLAAARMAAERGDHTLQPTELVHEAYLRLVGPFKGHGWDSRGHFFAAAAEAMRRILVENGRRKQQMKNGGRHKRVPLTDIAVLPAGSLDEMIAIDEALHLLEHEDKNAATLVKLRYFTGMTLEEAAESLGVSSRTAYRDWSYARAWLFRALGETPGRP
jgi:RNA polymerase sigma factor (TIGR02999 family)